MKRVVVAFGLAFVLPVALYFGGVAVGFEMGVFWYFLICLAITSLYVWRSDPRLSKPRDNW